MAKMTPAMHAKGLFQLKTPWPASLQAIYEVIAIRSFSDFTKKGESVFDLFYRPLGLTQQDYENDAAEGAHIVTLRSSTAATIFVPDTYILGYPALDTVAYSRIVLSVDLGPMPSDLALDFIKDALATAASDITGNVATVKEHAVPYAAIVTETEHATLESARQAAISNRKIDRARVIEYMATIDAQAATIDELQNIIIGLQSGP